MFNDGEETVRQREVLRFRQGRKGGARKFQLEKIRLKCNLKKSQHKNLVMKAIKRGGRMTMTL